MTDYHMAGLLKLQYIKIIKLKATYFSLNILIYYDIDL